MIPLRKGFKRGMKNRFEGVDIQAILGACSSNRHLFLEFRAEVRQAMVTYHSLDPHRRATHVSSLANAT